MKINWTGHMKDEDVLRRGKEGRNILHTIKRKKVVGIGHIFPRDCLLSSVIEGNIEGKRRRGRRYQQLLRDVKKKRKYSNLKDQALDRIAWRSDLGRSYGYHTRRTA
jgi:hypothetical protein